MSMDTQPAADLSADDLELLDYLMEDEGLEIDQHRIMPRTQHHDLPLSFAQQRLWFLDQFQPGSSAYHMMVAVQIRGALDPAAFARSLAAVVARHESLRTTFALRDSQPVQVIAPGVDVPLSVVDVPPLPGAARDARIADEVSSEIAQPFDLQMGPLLRARLLRLSATEHILILTLHHIVSDGWSQNILLRELTTFYRGFARGEAHPESIRLPELPIQYADYALWQRTWLQGQILEQQLAYWREHLAGIVPLDLPTDYPRPLVATDQGAYLTVEIAPALSEALRDLGQQLGATLFMTLLAAFQVLLHRYSGQADLAVGSPIAGRTRPELEGLIGFFANTLVLRSQVAGRLRFTEFMTQVQTICLDAYAHQDVPFEAVVDQLQPERDLSRSPLVQVVFVLQNTPPVTVDLDDLSFERLAVERQTVRFDLALTLNETATGLQGRFEYRTDLFATATIAQLAGHFQRLLEAIVADPEQRIDRLPLLTDAEQHQLLATWNATTTPMPEARCLHELVAAQAERTPDAVAVTAGRQALTYADLNGRANQLAHYLSAQGVGPDVLVALCVERSLEMVVGLLGILKAGGAYVPLDPAYPAERLQYMLSHSRAPVILTQAALVTRLPEHQAQVVCLDADWERLADQPTANPPQTGLPEQLAYIIYTSGSTGQPKGVLVAHRGQVNLALAQRAVCAVTPDSRVLQFASLSFDASIWEVVMALMAGAQLELLPSGPPLLGAGLAAFLADRAITHVTLPPSVLATLPAHALPDLETVIVAGEACPVELVQRWATGRRFINGYGPTETTVCATLGMLAPDAPTVSIGRPLANTQVYVLDGQLQPVPIGVTGELYIGGVGVARGYLHRPDLTAERFLPDLFSPNPGARLYRTGDLARYRRDGTLEFMGRVDHQVKLRGFRIELGEIESVMRRHPAVDDALVILHDERLVAYVVVSHDNGDDGDRSEGSWRPGENHGFGSSELRAFLATRLPTYLVPSAFVLLDGWPLTPNGKIDRRALPDPDTHRLPIETAFVAPGTPVETTLARIWAEVLRVETVGVHDNFFALGGDSILSIQIVARATQAGLRLTPRQLFQHQTIAELALVADTAPLVTADQGVISGPVPLTPIQNWFFAVDQPEPHHFNQAVLLESRQPLDPVLLDQAVQQLLVHHDALRLRYSHVSSVWQQQILPPDGASVVTTIDLSAVTVPEQRAALTAAATEMQASLDLASGPLLRVAAFDLGRQQPGRLLVVVHHLAVDAVSWSILLADLQTAYTQLQQGGVVTLPPKTTSFKAWAERLRAYAQSSTLHDELEYWLQTGRQPVPPLPVDRPDGDNTQGSIARIRLTLSAADTQALLQEVPRVYHAQINDVLLTALALAWAAWSGATTLRLDLEGHGREEVFDDVDLTRTVGWFTSLFPVRLDLGTVREPGAALKTIKEQLRAIPQHGIGYGVLRYLAPAEIRAALEEFPAAEVAFNYLGQLDHAIAADGWVAPAAEDAGPAVSPLGRRQYLLEVSGFVAGGQLQMSWTYSTALHHHSTVERLAAAYQSALEALIAHCLSPDAGGFTPADFPLARLDQGTLDRVVGAERQIDDLYPLSPMQHGMLVHTLVAGGSGVYVEQLACVLEGSLDPAAFRHAWATVVERHAVFRTAFVWDGLDEPLQVVRRQVTVPWTIEDWRGLTPKEQDGQRMAYLQADRRRGFALDEPPLLRLALFRLYDERHVFVWTHHHILLDGWSLPLVFNEVVRGYEQLVQGRELPVAWTRPYRDYIAWVRRQDLAQAEAFWRQQLQGFTVPTPLGIEQYPSAAGGDARPLTGDATVSRATTAALETLASQHSLTLSTLVQGAWALLLSRYSGEQDVVFGVTVAGRPADLAGVEAMVGLFINTLPVRAQVRPGDRLRSYLAQLQARLLEARQYEYSPLVQVQRWSEVPPGQPLFESIVVVENYPLDPLTAARGADIGLTITAVQAIEHTNYALTLAAIPGPELKLSLTYDGQRFDPASIDRLLGHLYTLLAGFAADPDQHLGAVPLLTETEAQQLLGAWHATTTAFPSDACLHYLFAAQAARTPDAIAVVAGAQQLTYAELNDRANQLAHHLQRLGVGPEICVGVLLERSLDLVVALLGILKAGGVYVPLDPAYPADRLRFMLANSRARVVLTQESSRDRLPPFTGSVVCLDRDRETIARQPTTTPAYPASSQQLAYVIYTSGSTGTPKGVAVSHAALVDHAATIQQVYGLSPSDRVLQFASPSFDVSIEQIVPPLLSGACVVLRDAELASPGDFTRLIAAAALTVVDLPPVYWREWVSAVEEETLPVPSRLRLVIVGGDTLPADTVHRWRSSALQTVRLVNAYGPSETTITATIFELPADTAGASSRQRIPIGRPLARRTARILDRHGALVPIGIAGELHLGGGLLARGYLDRPDLTAEQFIPDAFASDPGARLYRTGDLARYLPDGTIDFLGRIDQQVKLRGFRIELGEIEAALRQHPAVDDAAVLLRAERLVAYVVENKEQTGRPLGEEQQKRDESMDSCSLLSVLCSQELHQFLQKRLPEYMIPTAWVLLDTWPLTPNGKLDRNALPAPDMATPRATALVGPRTPTEELIAAVWRDVLGLEEVGI
ncbi:MAG TPA: amino acid adenylation domain-containing protein, partial [Herpetosiphonaceae bacterium]